MALAHLTAVGKFIQSLPAELRQEQEELQVQQIEKMFTSKMKHTEAADMLMAVQQLAISDGMKARLVKKITSSMVASAECWADGRRVLQNWSNFWVDLPLELWARISMAPATDHATAKMHALLEYLWLKGLRQPSEGTVQAMTGLYVFALHGGTAFTMLPMNLHVNFTAVKHAFKKFRGEDPPKWSTKWSDVDGVPASYPVAPLDPALLMGLILRIPMRNAKNMAGRETSDTLSILNTFAQGMFRAMQGGNNGLPTGFVLSGKAGDHDHRPEVPLMPALPNKLPGTQPLQLSLGPVNAMPVEGDSQRFSVEELPDEPKDVQLNGPRRRLSLKDATALLQGSMPSEIVKAKPTHKAVNPATSPKAVKPAPSPKAVKHDQPKYKAVTPVKKNYTAKASPVKNSNLKATPKAKPQDSAPSNKKVPTFKVIQASTNSQPPLVTCMPTEARLTVSDLFLFIVDPLIFIDAYINTPFCSAPQPCSGPEAGGAYAEGLLSLQE